MENYSDYFPFELREQQKKVFDALCDFIVNPNSKVFILRGYAGTGKTTLIGGFIKKMNLDTQEDANTKMPGLPCI